MSLNPQERAAVEAAELEIRNKKRETIRMMAANIYGHLHGDGQRGLFAKSELISVSVEIAQAIWQEVQEQVT